MKGWTEKPKKLEKEFSFKDFKTAMSFVNKIAEAAEEMNHHPDILIHYNRVKIELWTHDANDLTEKDRALSVKIDTFL